MEKMSFGFWWGSPTLSKSESTQVQLQQFGDTASAVKPEAYRNLTQQDINAATPASHNSELDASNSGTKTLSDLQLEPLLSNLLKYGVLIASAVIFIGGLLYIIRHGSEPAQYQIFKEESFEFRSPVGVIDVIRAGSYRGIIQLGLLLLVAVPILRVVISLFIFLRQGDYTYVVITSIVLTALMCSFLGAF
ncbi:hypothetical protein WA1_16365 [Scytonema hofmannii PCC 7110]|uniref:DUF1634 domain-containing protein n=1 Tax=Scytonema hofmannii PCC 7110 TaxID=128403 RepID=A0A139XAH1_9CYAN|nr:DUF1634 domain-containing protein [Scytonema hofmannii]KYC41622.1 hypothetical protein WA1_16365 [Scytonema hofmannii PCC 7110]